MKAVSRKILMCALAALFVSFAAGTVLAQEDNTLAPAMNEEAAGGNAVSNEAQAPAQPAASESNAVEAPAPSSPESGALTNASASSTPREIVAPQWIWGEVVSVDKANNQLQIKHLDYETYEEVTKVIQVDSGTLYENAGGLGDLKPGDSVTVDFKMKEGAQVAELVVVDKNHQVPEEKAPAESAPASDNAAQNVMTEPPAAAPASVVPLIPAAPMANETGALGNQEAAPVSNMVDAQQASTPAAAGDDNLPGTGPAAREDLLKRI